MNVHLHRYVSDLRFAICAVFIVCLLPLSARSNPTGVATSFTDTEFIQTIDEEYAYRQQMEVEAPKWVRELMYIYKWSAKHPVSFGHFGQQRPTSQEVKLRMASEFAWLAITGHALLATFDFQHAEQSLLGSTSRIVSTLTKSRAFWVEVKKQCLEINNPDGPKACAERFRRDLGISQLVGSNVSLFVGGGVVIALGKKVFQKYLSNWFAARVLPLIPLAARSKWVIGSAMAAIIVLPAGFVVASLEEEKETSRKFLEGLPEALKETQSQAEKESVMRMKGLELESHVFELAIWINQHLPSSASGELRRSFEELQAHQAEAERFVADLKLFAPRYSMLQEKRGQVIEVRELLEAEFRTLPNAGQRLLEIAEKRKHGALSVEDAKLFRSAQYLAALRLVAKVL